MYITYFERFLSEKTYNICALSSELLHLLRLIDMSAPSLCTELTECIVYSVYMPIDTIDNFALLSFLCSRSLFLHSPMRKSVDSVYRMVLICPLALTSEMAYNT